MPKIGRSLIGIVAGFKSEWWPVFDRNAGRLHVGIRKFSDQDHSGHAVDQARGSSTPVDLEKPSVSSETLHAEALAENLPEIVKSSLALEEQMADETDLSEATTTETVLSNPPEPKKRGPRAKKSEPDATNVAVAVEAPVAKQARVKRGRKKGAADTQPSLRRGGRKPKDAVASGPTNALPVSPSMTAVEEMEDLLQFEQENLRLRKLLVEKLRGENADLRKRLDLS